MTGRKRLYLIGLAIFAIFSAACGLARTDLELIQQVAGAEAQAVAAVLGPAVLVPLTEAGILLLAGAVIGFTFLRERGSSAPTGKDAALPGR